MKFNDKYLPKFKSTKRNIPVYEVTKNKDFYNFFHKEMPFILKYNLIDYLNAALSDIGAVDKKTRIKTFDSIPYKEIREGLFFDYLKYVNSNNTDTFYPNNFKIIEEVKDSKTTSRFRHYALSLNESLFPNIANFKVPFIEQDNYLLQLNLNFFSENNIISPHWLFIHPQFSVSNAHYDHDFVHTSIFQLKGSKYVCLVSPMHQEIIRNKEFPLLPNGFNDFTNNDIEHLPSNDLETWEGIIEENQILFIPKRWVHYVLGLTSGISYSQDLVLENNYNEWITSISNKNKHQ
jgi:hypothetical protein